MAAITRKQPGYRAPPELRTLRRTKKIPVPVREYPGYNFIGLINGPRGHTQQRMQQESGARITLRGRGSAKEGSQCAGQADPSDNEDLHVLITAETEESMSKVLPAFCAARACRGRSVAWPGCDLSYNSC